MVVFGKHIVTVSIDGYSNAVLNINPALRTLLGTSLDGAVHYACGSLQRAKFFCQDLYCDLQDQAAQCTVAFLRYVAALSAVPCASPTNPTNGVQLTTICEPSTYTSNFRITSK
jgi:hypothetical protein